MYSLEECAKAVKLYIDAGCNEEYCHTHVGATLPPTHLGACIKSISLMESFMATSAPKPRIYGSAKGCSIEYFAMYHTALTQTCRAMG